MEDVPNNLKIPLKTNILLFVVTFANFIRYLGLSIIQIGLPDFILNLSGTLISYGIVIGAFNATQSIFQFPMAAASDKFGRKIMIIVGIFVYTIGTLLCFLAQSIVELIIYRAIQGAGAYTSILQAVLGDVYKKEEKGKGMALYSLSLTLGYTGIIIGGYISFYLNFRSIFLINGILAIISFILIVIFFKSPKNSKETTARDVNEKKKRVSFSLNDFKILLKERQYQYAIILNSFRWLCFGGIISYLVWVFQVHFGLNEIETSYILIVTITIYIIFLMITGRLVDRRGTRKMMLIGQIIVIVFGFLFFIVNITNNLLIYIFASLCQAIGFGILQTAGNTLLLQKIEVINPELRGAGLGLGNSIGFMFSAIGPVVLSVLGEFELFLPYYFIIILTIPCLLISLKLIDK